MERTPEQQSRVHSVAVTRELHDNFERKDENCQRALEQKWGLKAKLSAKRDQGSLSIFTYIWIKGKDSSRHLPWWLRG